ncbi:hypothetical protein BYT27DRAFT_6459046 [Phlegmacium glaucopus]|nr:hypothetical protein BYT27DRAFT_6459046 [Phlegmacium glaucopus]
MGDASILMGLSRKSQNKKRPPVATLSETRIECDPKRHHTLVSLLLRLSTSLVCRTASKTTAYFYSRWGKLKSKCGIRQALETLPTSMKFVSSLPPAFAFLHCSGSVVAVMSLASRSDVAHKATECHWDNLFDILGLPEYLEPHHVPHIPLLPLYLGLQRRPGSRVKFFHIEVQIHVANVYQTSVLREEKTNKHHASNTGVVLVDHSNNVKDVSQNDLRP